MGCGKICKAKRKAKEAREDADKQKKDAEKKKQEALAKARQAANEAGTSQVITVKSYTTEVITIGKFLGIDSKQNALSIRDMVNIFNVAKKTPEIIASSVAMSLVRPLSSFFGLYEGLSKLIMIFQIAKPIIKIAMQIGDIITFNFAALGELASDIFQMITQIMLGFAPMLIEMLKNIFLNIPLYIKIIPLEQKIRIQGILKLKHLQIRDNIKTAIDNFSPKTKKPYCAGGISQTCHGILESSQRLKATENEMNIILSGYIKDDPLMTLEDLTDVVVLKEDVIEYMTEGIKCSKKEVLSDVIDASKQESIDVTRLPETATYTAEEKNELGQALDGLLVAYEKIEAAATEELLRQEFEVSQVMPIEEQERFANIMLAEIMSENVIAELRKILYNILTKFNKSVGTVYPRIEICRVLTYELRKEVQKKLEKVKDRKQDLITVSVTKELVESNKIQIFNNVIKSIKTVKFEPETITLDPCMTNNVENDFINLKADIIADNTVTINNTPISDSIEMIALRDQVVEDIILAVNDEVIVSEPSCGFGNSVCENITIFKADLVKSINENMRGSDLDLSDTELPSYANRKKVNDMKDLFYGKIVDEISTMIRKIILESAIPCKACRPCEDMVDDLVQVAERRINELKDKIINNTNEMILDEDLNWSIAGAPSVILRKQQLIDVMTEAINKNIGKVELYDLFIYKLRMEEEALISNITNFIKAS